MDMAHKISIYEYRSECYYHEHSTAFYANLYELLKDPSRVEQLVKEGYVVFNYYLDRVDRAPDIEFLKALQDHFLELERKGELYTTGDPDPYMLFLYQPEVIQPLAYFFSSVALKAGVCRFYYCESPSLGLGLFIVFLCLSYKVGLFFRNIDGSKQRALYYH